MRKKLSFPVKCLLQIDPYSTSFYQKGDNKAVIGLTILIHGVFQAYHTIIY